MSRQRKYTTVSIPVTLYERIKNIIKDTGFTSVSDFVTYVLREVVAMYESEKSSEYDGLSEEDLEKIKRRLKALGYL